MSSHLLVSHSAVALQKSTSILNVLGTSGWPRDSGAELFRLLLSAERVQWALLTNLASASLVKKVGTLCTCASQRIRRDKCFAGEVTSLWVELHWHYNDASHYLLLIYYSAHRQLPPYTVWITTSLHLNQLSTTIFISVASTLLVCEDICVELMQSSHSPTYQSRLELRVLTSHVLGIEPENFYTHNFTTNKLTKTHHTTASSREDMVPKD